MRFTHPPRLLDGDEFHSLQNADRHLRTSIGKPLTLVRTREVKNVFLAIEQHRSKPPSLDFRRWALGVRREGQCRIEATQRLTPGCWLLVVHSCRGREIEPANAAKPRPLRTEHDHKHTKERE